MALTDRTALKLHLGIPAADTSEDSELDQWISGVEAAVLTFLNRNIESGSYTEYHDGHNWPELYLRQYPLTAVTSVHVDQDGFYGDASGSFPSETEWSRGVDYAIPRTDEDEGNRGLLKALKWRNFDPGSSGIWPQGSGNIKVVYTAGYSSVPAEISLAVNILIAQVRAAREAGFPLAGEQLGAYSYSVLTGAVPGLVEGINQASGILCKYQRKAVAA